MLLPYKFLVYQNNMVTTSLVRFFVCVYPLSPPPSTKGGSMRLIKPTPISLLQKPSLSTRYPSVVTSDISYQASLVSCVHQERICCI